MNVIPLATLITYTSISFMMTGCNITSKTENSLQQKDTEITIKGKIIDGYLSNSTVYLDINNNNILDDKEPNTKTDQVGNYSLTIPMTDYNENKSLIAEGGRDIASGLTFKGILKTPLAIGNENEVNLTPLTTLISFKNEKTKNITSTIKQISKILAIDTNEASKDITTDNNLKSKILLIQKLFDISQLYILNKQDYINFIKSYSQKLNSYNYSNYNEIIDLLKNDIEMNTNIDSDILDLMVNSIKKETNQLNMDMKIKKLKRYIKSPNPNKNINTLKESISEMEKENLNNPLLNKLKIGFNKYNFELTESEYNFYSSRYPEFKNIKFDNIEEEIKSIKNTQLKTFLQHIINKKAIEGRN